MFKLLFSFILIIPTLSSAGEKELETVSSVDLNRYVGEWYEIAAIPQSFQSDCNKNTQARYRLLENGLVEVINTCVKEDGSTKEAVGRARVEDKDTNSKLKVTFVKLGDWIFQFGGEYWIIDLDPNYAYSVVGHPKRTYGWILSREPQMSVDTLMEIEKRLSGKGYDTCKFLMSPQDLGYQEKTQLCELR